MKKQDCQTVTSRNKRCSGLNESFVPYPVKHKYIYAKYICMHGKSRHCKKKLLNQGTPTDEKASGCPAKVLVSSNRENGVLVLSQFYMVHNHVLDDVGLQVTPMETDPTKEGMDS